MMKVWYMTMNDEDWEWIKVKICDRAAQILLQQANAEFDSGIFPKWNIDAAMNQAIEEFRRGIESLVNIMVKEETHDTSR